MAVKVSVGHDTQMIQIVQRILPNHQTSGASIQGIHNVQPTIVPVRQRETMAYAIQNVTVGHADSMEMIASQNNASIQGIHDVQPTIVAVRKSITMAYAT